MSGSSPAGAGDGRGPSLTERVVRDLGAYYVVTGLAPFVSRTAFEAVTGRKREWWLVQTVGALAGVSGAVMLRAAARRRVTPEIVGLAAGNAASLAAIDVVHVARGRIAPSYLVDAAVELAALAALGTGVSARARRRAGA